MQSPTYQYARNPIQRRDLKSPRQPYLEQGDGPIVLVVAPTRELAVQIKEECDKFGGSSDIKNTCVYGGVPKRSQVRDNLRSEKAQGVLVGELSSLFSVLLS